ncbi:MAG: DUF4349 domain-containing protein [Halanaerobacter sp.]
MFKKFKTTKLFLLILISFTLIISGCQGSNHPEQSKEARPTMQNESRSSKFGSPDTSQKSAVKEEDYQAQEAIERKIIKESNLKITTKDLSSISKKVKDIIKAYDGYLANSNQWQSDRRYYRFTLKVPQKNFQTAIDELEKLGEIDNKRISSRDITREYIDLQSRLKSYQAQEERYLELLDQARNVEDILKIEKELNRVRRKIEQIQGQLNYYNNKVSFSTINVTFSEPKPVINNNSWGILDSLKQSIQEFVDSINAIIVISGALIPWLVLTALLAFIIYKIWKNRK